MVLTWPSCHCSLRHSNSVSRYIAEAFLSIQLPRLATEKFGALRNALVTGVPGHNQESLGDTAQYDSQPWLHVGVSWEI